MMRISILLLVAFLFVAPGLACSSTSNGSQSTKTYTVLGVGTIGSSNARDRSLCLVPRKQQASQYKCYTIASGLRSFETLASYPHCLRATIVGDKIQSWTAAAC